MKKHASLFFGLVCLFACDKPNETPATMTPSSTSELSLDQESLEQFRPVDQALAEKYERSCFICHTNLNAQAPLVGDKAAWQKLINEKGMQVLLQNVNQGFKNMPPKGQCFDCTDQEFEQLIQFMSEPKS